MRIGLFTDQVNVGISGQATSVLLLYQNLKKMGHDVFVFTCHTRKVSDDDPNIINLTGIPYPIKNAKGYRFSPNIRKNVKLIESYNLDIIHVHTEFYMARVALEAKKHLGLPIVYTLHTMWEYYLDYLSKPLNRVAHDRLWRLVRRVVFRKLVRTVDVIVVPSVKLYNRRGRYGIGDNAVIIPTGIDLEQFDKLQPNAKPDVRSGDKTVFLYLGRLSSEKSIDVLLQAFAKMKNKDNATFMIVGGGPAERDLKKLAEKLGIMDYVNFVGPVPREDTPLYYHSADAFLSASKTETQGLTFSEALASHLPVYAIRDEAVEDVIEDGKNGFLCDSVVQLTQKMDELVEKNNAPSEFGSLEGYSAQDYAQKLSELYGRVLSGEEIEE